MITYSYDGLQRLSGAIESTGTSYTYTYDLVGNRTSAYINSLKVGQWAYGAADQVVGWHYDAAGNLLDDGAARYRYDPLSRLTRVSQGSSTSYAYNGDGVITRYAQDRSAPASAMLL